MAGATFSLCWAWGVSLCHREGDAEHQYIPGAGWLGALGNVGGPPAMVGTLVLGQVGTHVVQFNLRSPYLPLALSPSWTPIFFTEFGFICDRNNPFTL